MTWEQLPYYFSTHSEWLWPLLVVSALLASLLLKLLLKLISAPLRRLSLRTGSIWDDAAADVLDGLKTPVLFVWLFYILSKYQKVSEATDKIWLTAVVVVTIFQVGLWGMYLIRRWRENFVGRRVKEDPSASAALGLMFVTLQCIFIALIVLIGLSNLGVDIGALVAGLGVGGIAVALAAQNVLGDLLASLSIVLDKPFVVGDFIAVGEDLGNVENIGIKTTRVRSLSGEELIFSNKDLLESRVRNYKRMYQRRVVQSFGVTYSTPADTLAAIPEWVKAIVTGDDKVKFDRCHFSQYGDSSLNFELVFWVKDPDYNVYMDCQQRILLEIFRKFAAEGVDFAFPSRSLYLEKSPALAEMWPHPGDSEKTAPRFEPGQLPYGK